MLNSRSVLKYLRKYSICFTAFYGTYLVYLFFNLSFTKLINCAGIVNSRNLCNLHSICVDHIKNMKKNNSQFDRSQIIEIVREILKNEKIFLDIYSEQWFLGPSEDEKDNGFSLLSFKYNVIDRAKSRKFHASHRDECFLLNDKCEEIYKFRVGMPTSILHSFIKIGDNDKIEYNKIICDLQNTQSVSLSSTKLKKQKEITLFPKLGGLKFMIVAIRETDFEDSNSLYKKLEKHIDTYVYLSVFKYNSVYYFITLEDQMILGFDNLNFRNILNSIVENYESKERFFALLEPFVCNYRMTFHFSLVYKSTFTNDAIKNKSINITGSVPIQDEYSTINYNDGNLRYKQSKIILYYVCEFDDTSIKSFTPSSLKNVDSKLNAVQQTKFKNADKFIKAVNNGWYSIIFETYKAYDRLILSYYVGFNGDKILQKSFDLNEFFSCKIQSKQETLYKFLEPLKYTFQSETELKEEIRNYCIKFKELEDLFCDLYYSRILLDDFTGTYNLRIKIIIKFKSQLKNLSEGLSKIFSNLSKNENPENEIFKIFKDSMNDYIPDAIFYNKDVMSKKEILIHYEFQEKQRIIKIFDIFLDKMHFLHS